MAPLFLCTCRSHCTEYNAGTNTYTRGQMVDQATRFQHRRDDIRPGHLDDFATRVASTILDENSHLGLSHGVGNSSIFSPLSMEMLPQELLTIEAEVRGRITWAPTNQTLVFHNNPVPDRNFEDPLLLSNYVPNSGPHALDESRQRNLAFIENENRLFEITLYLNTLTCYLDQCDELGEMVTTGLQEMMRHKKREWDRQRIETTAIDNGFAVVRTGLAFSIVCETKHF